MRPAIVITGVGACTALGSVADAAFAGLVAGTCKIQIEGLNAGFSVLFGRVAEMPPLVDRSRDFTFDLAELASLTALEQSGLRDAYRTEDVATILGCSKGRLYEIAAAEPPIFSPSVFPGNTLGLEVARRFGFAGPVLNYPAACATGLACIIAATNLIAEGVTGAVLAGSAEASGFRLIIASFGNMGALAPRQMQPFHTDRCGFNAGEGAAAFVLEEEHAAASRGAKIVARICGWDMRSDAHHLTSPETSGNVVAECIRRTLRLAGWKPSDVEYINAHGTGTRQNDAIEARAIADVFGAASPLVSSLKPYIGHLLGGSAAAELALSIIALRNGFVPATLGLERPDPTLSEIRHVPPGGVQQKIKRFLKLSLGFGGHLGCLAVELNRD